MSNLGNVRGTADALPPEAAVNREIFDTLRAYLESFGYNGIDVPVIEHTDLFLTKSGEDIISKMYSFTFKNRSICLRPEFTASIGRAFVSHLQGSSLPLRLYYHGPVFRYEKPQKGRYRQFTQMGVELIGAPSPGADAEILHCACSGLERLGLTDYHVVIGHIGVITELLRAFGLDRRAEVFLIQNMENLSKDGKGIDHVRTRLREVYPPSSPATELSALADSLAAGPSPLDVNMLKLFSEMSEEESRAFLRDFLAHMEIGEGLGNRDPEDIVERLLRKLRQKDQTSRIIDALEFVHELNQLAGPPAEALPRVRDLLDSYGLKRSALTGLEQLVAALDPYGVDWGKVSVNLGMGRGLQYYTGMIFEIYHQTVSSENQVCGGGRYDDLIHALGGNREVPACGFSYGLERLRLALGRKGNLPRAQVLVIPVEEADCRYAIEVAQALRRGGLRVEMDVRQRGVKSNLQYADKVKIPFCLIIGERERRADSVVVREMQVQQESLVERAGLAELAERMMGQMHV
jgi:histidyl-tRNA synthetase